MNGFPLSNRIYISKGEIALNLLCANDISQAQISMAIDKYADMVKRICFLYLHNSADVEDVFQEVFLKFMLNQEKFDNEQHEKAWLCRVTYNQCKDMLKSFWRKKVVSIDNMDIAYRSREYSDLLAAVRKLPSSSRQIIYLHYYEQMSVPEIAEILHQNTNTVYTQLRRAKTQIKSQLGDDYFEQ